MVTDRGRRRERDRRTEDRTGSGQGGGSGGSGSGGGGRQWCVGDDYVGGRGAVVVGNGDVERGRPSARPCQRVCGDESARGERRPNERVQRRCEWKWKRRSGGGGGGGGVVVFLLLSVQQTTTLLAKGKSCRRLAGRHRNAPWKTVACRWERHAPPLSTRPTLDMHWLCWICFRTRECFFFFCQCRLVFNTPPPAVSSMSLSLCCRFFKHFEPHSETSPHPSPHPHYYKWKDRVSGPAPDSLLRLF